MAHRPITVASGGGCTCLNVVARKTLPSSCRNLRRCVHHRRVGTGRRGTFCGFAGQRRLLVHGE